MLLHYCWIWSDQEFSGWLSTCWSPPKLDSHLGFWLFSPESSQVSHTVDLHCPPSLNITFAILSNCQRQNAVCATNILPGVSDLHVFGLHRLHCCVTLKHCNAISFCLDSKFCLASVSDCHIMTHNMTHICCCTALRRCKIQNYLSRQLDYIVRAPTDFKRLMFLCKPFIIPLLSDMLKTFADVAQCWLMYK